MGASQIPAASTGGATSDNYVLISSVTPTAAASTVSFTSISGYRKLLFRWLDTTLATAGTINLTFNSDSGTNYAYSKQSGTSTLANFQSQKDTKINLDAATSTSQLGATYIIDGVATTGPKPFTGFGSTSGTTNLYIGGIYYVTAAITTVTLTATTTFSGVGTVALYGVAA
jgi:hypothetical protein